MASGNDGTGGRARIVDLLWGGPPRASRGPRPKLSLDRIVRTAIGIADIEGLDAVSMQRVAKELGYTTMSLYRHVPAKEQLVLVMVDTAVGRAPEVGRIEGWREQLEAVARALLATYQRRPWVLEAHSPGPPVGPGGLSWLEAFLGPLTRAGLDPGEAISAVTFLDGALRGLGRLGADMNRTRGRAGVSAVQAARDYADTLRGVVTDDAFPMLAGLVRDGLFDPPPGAVEEGAEEGVDMGTEVEFGLQRLLDGIHVHTRRRAAGLPPR
ncbi:TetR/AcrR family transcriptional regulator [Nocardiopsis sediminis]|uniref:TetR/AcrR family transcriptional regulator n=1 Tax=Nocardiopsis sediminis TaxID=1778267 RepID=A0ABV8FIL8_9ACTN